MAAKKKFKDTRTPTEKLYGELICDAINKAYRIKDIPVGTDFCENLFASILEAADAIRLADSVKEKIEADAAKRDA